MDGYFWLIGETHQRFLLCVIFLLLFSFDTPSRAVTFFVTEGTVVWCVSSFFFPKFQRVGNACAHGTVAAAFKG